MSLNRWACRRDANEKPIVDAARKLGVKLWELKEPADWLALISGRWYPCEIKTEKGKRTKKQNEFHADAMDAGGEILLWRSVDDMVADVRRLRIAR